MLLSLIGHFTGLLQQKHVLDTDRIAQSCIFTTVKHVALTFKPLMRVFASMGHCKVVSRSNQSRCQLIEQCHKIPDVVIVVSKNVAATLRSSPDWSD